MKHVLEHSHSELSSLSKEEWAARFSRKYIPEPNTGCWLWLGATCINGYGILQRNRKHIKATHVSLLLCGRPVSKGLNALHHCDNPPCVNPDHLYVGTKAENMSDSYRRNRRLPPPHPTPSISKEEAAHVRAHLNLLSGYGKIAIVSRATGLSRQVVRGVADGRIYPDVAPLLRCPITDVGCYSSRWWNNREFAA